MSIQAKKKGACTEKDQFKTLMIIPTQEVQQYNYLHQKEKCQVLHYCAIFKENSLGA